ncbi:MAG: endonuclease/exonuclease/phosphatase family protein, partial [Planctomycetota bacterium]
MAAKRSRSARILSWNVNGIRAAADKGFCDWLARSRAEIVGIQEVRADAAQIPAELRAPKGLHAAFSASERKGYSG